MTQTQTAEVQKYIMSLAYPCSRDELAAHMRAHGANEEIVRAIRSLPYDYFTSPYAIQEAMYP